MIAQVLLTLLLLLIVLYAWIASSRAPLLSVLFMLLAGAALYFVWIPHHATLVAHAVGIGRGVDLIIYLWIVVSLLAILNIHLHLRVQTEVITELARHIALKDALAHVPSEASEEASHCAPVP